VEVKWDDGRYREAEALKGWLVGSDVVGKAGADEVATKVGAVGAGAEVKDKSVGRELVLLLLVVDVGDEDEPDMVGDGDGVISVRFELGWLQY